MEEKYTQQERAENMVDNQENNREGAPDASGAEFARNENENETEILQNQLSELKDKYLRLVADFDNFRKRTAKERLELIQTASKDVISNLLTVLDDTERAENRMQKAQDIESVKEGIGLVFNKLRSTLQAQGLRPMESVGKEFNPEYHEAITEIPSPDKQKVGTVLDEVQKGYYLNDKIIRHAKVVVGK